MVANKAKNLFITSAMVFTSLFSLSTFAATELVNINIECPRTKDDGGTTGIGVVHNDGLIINGMGKEIINGKNFPNPIFSGETPSDVPTRIEIGAYYRSDVTYEPEKGNVTCFYSSTAGYPPFTIDYHIINGRGGMMKYKTPKSIYVSYMVGIKK